MEKLLELAKDLDIKQQKKLANALLQHYYYKHCYEYMITKLNPTNDNIIRLFVYSDFILYELEHAQKKLKSKFKEREQDMIIISELMKDVNEGMEPVNQDDAFRNSFINAMFRSYAYETRLDYLIDTMIDKKEIDKEMYVAAALREIAFYNSLGEENRRVVKNMFLVLLD